VPFEEVIGREGSPRFCIRIPASSANLGPGYDSFGLALALYNDIEADPADCWRIEVHGEGAGHLRTDEHNLVAKAAIAATESLGEPPVAARVVCRNGIPTGSGLGSSSAAIVGGIMLGYLLAGHEPDREAMFRLADRLEGHPDNVGAAVWGGFTVSYPDVERDRCASVPIVGGLAAVVVARDVPLRTREARALLPDLVPHRDAAFNAAHAGLTVAGFVLGRADLVRAGLEDRLHEQYRSAAIEDLAEVRAVLVEAGADGAALSGAGPTVVGIVTAGDDGAALSRAREVAAAAAPLVGRIAGRRAPMALPIDRAGVIVR
jgi:homoserine kinase